jgi:hypothetical protein
MRHLFTLFFLLITIITHSQESIRFENEDIGYETIELILNNNKTFQLKMTIPVLTDETEGGAIYNVDRYNYYGSWTNEYSYYQCIFDSIDIDLKKLFLADQDNVNRILFINDKTIKFSESIDTLHVFELPIIKRTN